MIILLVQSDVVIGINFGANQLTYLKLFYNNNFEFGLYEASVDKTKANYTDISF